ncbi:type II toxin-antitoxin system HicB family antitoxin [Bacteroides sedimenti]|uniref:Type II toxin-antitoxin system HicB family antitoxin n=1 Tax=Bacteroides sedimenti TaxID=2136147 RepID=A0ABM8ICN6_9BACE
MKLNKEDYVIERTTDGGYCAYLSWNMQCMVHGDTPEEALDSLQETINDYIHWMYLVDEFV